MIAARQIFLGRGGAKLPYDAEVEYLESTGTQWIDTGFKANTGTTSFEIFLTPKNISQYPQGLFGSRNTLSAADSSFNAFMLTGGAVRADFVGSARGLNSGMTANSLFVIRYDNRRVYVNGVPDIMSYAGNSTLQDYNFLVGSFTNGDGTPYSGGFIGLIRYVKLWSSGVLVRDMIPVRFTNEQGMSEGAMYDRVSKQLFRNQGAGAFLYGPDKIPVETDRYVQDGLVAMWDGKENAGVGLHDPNATVWKDLIGDLDIILPGSDYFASDHLVHVSGTPQSENDTRICEGTNLTIESVFEASSDSTIYTCSTQAGSGSTSNGSGFGQYSLRYQAAGNPSYSRFSRGNGTSWGYSVYSSIPTPIGEICSLVDVVDFDVANRKYSYRYVNGQLANTYPFRDGPVGYTVTDKMRVFTNQPCHGHCLRIYNRALTAEEIAANYAVDKQRFNLP